jgi:hypothetical protein
MEHVLACMSLHTAQKHLDCHGDGASLGLQPLL